MSLTDIIKSFDEKNKPNLEIESSEKGHLITPTNDLQEETNTIKNENDNEYVIIY